MSYDRHSRCESCLGSEHAALAQQLSCAHCHCARLPLSDRQRRADALATVAEEDDWPVQESYSVDQALEFLDPSAGQESDDSIHGSPCGSLMPILPWTEETEMEPGAGLARLRDPLSAITALPSIGRNCLRSSKRQPPGEVSSFPRLRRALLPVAGVFLPGTDRQE